MVLTIPHCRHFAHRSPTTAPARRNGQGRSLPICIPYYCNTANFSEIQHAPYKKMDILRMSILFLMLALPIFPASHPASIVGACELNFCVRDGNRWTLTAINTNFFRKAFAFLYVKALRL